MSKWIIGTLLFVVATVTWAQTKKSDPQASICWSNHDQFS